LTKKRSKENAMRKLSLLLLILWLTQAPFALAETVLHRGNGAEPETLDIHKSSGVPEANIQRDLFEGLLTEGADGSSQPGVAEKWDISADGKLYTFHLRADAKWSDGTPVTADDFVYAYQRALAPATASDYAFILWPIDGAESYNKGEQKDPKQIGVKAVDAHTLEIRLKTPTPYFLGMLMHHMAYPVPKAVVEKVGQDWTKPGNILSNGAYRLVEWKPQAQLKLEKNPYYRRAKEIAIDTVYYIPTEDKNTELKRFRAGELDITDDVPSDQMSWVKENLPTAFHNSPYIGTFYYAFNLENAAFKANPKLRRALSLAIDRDILTEKITQAGEIPAWGWVPAVDGYNQQTMEEKSLDKAARTALAQQLYAESGYGEGKPLELEILYNTSDNNKKLAVAIAAMWKQVLGVTTTLRNEEWKVYLSSRKQKQFQVMRASWIGDYNDAHTFLSLFKSDVGEMNPSSYNNPEYDRLLHEAENQTDPKMRREAMEQAERVLLSDMPIVPIYHYTTQHLVNPAITGWQDNVMDVHQTQYLGLKP
jgi:oligopeptide transport system substrate-binding protein